MDDFQVREAARKCAFVRITTNNYFRVAEFRDKNRGSEYRDKLAREEIGFFAELGDTMVGSIWATMNRSQSPAIARGYMRLMPNEALIHDIVTGEKSRGLGVGPFMVGRMALILLKEFGVSRINMQVNFINKSSLRLMGKVGLPVRVQYLQVSGFGN